MSEPTHYVRSEPIPGPSSGPPVGYRGRLLDHTWARLLCLAVPAQFVAGILISLGISSGNGFILLLGWVLAAVGSSVVLVALIAAGVEIGIRDSR